jgi:hypothetical protein
MIRNFKTMLVAAALTVSGLAQADTIDLPAWAGLGALHQYWGVPVPDNTVTITLPANTPTGYMQLWFQDEVNPATQSFYSYWTGNYAGNGLTSQLQKCVFPMDATGSYPVGPCQLTGETMLVTIYDTSRTVCNHSGRGQGCHKLYTLLSGSLTQ